MTSATTTTFTSDNWFSSDEQFHRLYPEPIQVLARRHWTPLSITQMMAQFLTPYPGSKVLDIGSGVGKFCLAAAYYRPGSFFYGVEQRKDLITHAEAARSRLGLQNVHFLHSNFAGLDFSAFDHFYFYNSFYENLVNTDKIDDKIPCSEVLYNRYNRQLYKKLQEMRSGTRLVTYHSMENKIPPSYYLVEAQADELLKFWIKM